MEKINQTCPLCCGVGKELKPNTDKTCGLCNGAGDLEVLIFKEWSEQLSVLNGDS